jgi:transcriptional regulator with XRE-family HTH domain
MPKGARRRPARLAEKLLRIRHQFEFTQEELKERIEQLGFVSDLDRVDVSDFERGRRDPDLLTLLSYARLTNVYLDVLVDDGLDLPEELPSPYKHEGTRHIEPDKKTNARSEALRSVTVTLRLNVKGKTKLVRSANRVRTNIERYHLKGYGMRRLKEGGYKLTLPCKNEKDFKRRISALLEDIENEAVRDDCVVEAEAQERDDSQPGD